MVGQPICFFADFLIDAHTVIQMHWHSETTARLYNKILITHSSYQHHAQWPLCHISLHLTGQLHIGLLQEIDFFFVSVLISLTAFNLMVKQGSGT